MRFFTCGELWGPFPCEHPGCDQSTFTIRLTDADNARLPEETGPAAVQFIFANRLGKAVCDRHMND